MRKIVQYVVLAVVAILLGMVASVDVSEVPAQKEVAVTVAPTSEVHVADCSKCDTPCPDTKNDTTTMQEASDDEFKTVSADEFEDVSDNDSEFEDVSSADEEFVEVAQAADEFETVVQEEVKPLVDKSNKRLLVVVLSLFLATALAGILVSYPKLRSLRYVFLLLSLAIVGFAFGGNCPCMLKSFDNTILFFTGKDVKWASLVLFLGLIPLTYLFGKVWCGWICHFGALQEFIHKKSKWNFWKTAKAQKILFGVQTVVFVVWVAWLLIAQTSSVCRYDPFVKIFNLHINGMVNYIVVGLLVVLSLFVDRPFCRSLCPIGFVLGWVARLPFANKLGIPDICRGCEKCKNVCDKGCISGDKLQQHKIDVNGCIYCGECMSECPQKGISVSKK